VSRHRSPKGRRAYHGPPLSALAAAAGSGGAHRSDALPSVFPTPMHAVAAVVVGGTLAAAAQQALVTVMPAVDDGISAARASFNSAVAGPAATATVSPVVPEPAVADATSLVKAADLQQAAAKARARAVAAAPAAAPAVGKPALAPAPAAPRPAAVPAPAAVGGPVRILSGPVTSGFGGRWGTVHQGLDIAAPIGTPIHVPMGGVVISSGPASGFGMWVRVQHSDGTITVYGHINRSFVQVGQRVAAGQVIAETGNRGQSTGPHLHIGVMQNGVYVNPKPWLDAHGFLY
jgi:murein DD-endopeptidase MepM/ murein hydrolase activator NlpD